MQDEAQIKTARKFYSPTHNLGQLAALGIRIQLGQVLTLKPPQIQARQQRKKRRQEETGKGFRRLALNVMRRVVPSIFDDPDFWKHPGDDIHDRRAEAERLFHLQTEEWPNDHDHAQEHDSGFHYGTAASFDPHP